MFDSLPNCFSDEFVLRASELLFYVVFNDNLHHYYAYTNFQIYMHYSTETNIYYVDWHYTHRSTHELIKC